MKYLLFILILLFLCVIPVQGYFNWINEEKLKGDFIPKGKPEFSVDSLFKGGLEQQFSDYINENFGFRKTLVRIKNQVDYSLFNRANAEGVIVGKNDYTFHKRYIGALYGDDYIGDEFIKEKLRKIKALQDTLFKEGIIFCVVLEPSKARYMPENIPDNLVQWGAMSNYEALSKGGDDLIDINRFFLSLKDTVSYPLYPKSGIHWSDYGSLLSAQVIVKYIRDKKNLALQPITWTGMDITDIPHERDYDMGNTMNLLFPIKGPALAYPKINFSFSEPGLKPDALVISDSYFWNIEGQKAFYIPFRNVNLWYYNHDVYDNGAKKTVPANQLDLRAEIKNHKVIFLMQTELTLYDFGLGFIESAYDLYFPWDKENRTTYYERQIIKSRDWYKQIEKAAKDNGVPVREMLHNNAKWQADQEATK